jgi:hypothetical protein
MLKAEVTSLEGEARDFAASELQSEVIRLMDVHMAFEVHFYYTSAFFLCKSSLMRFSSACLHSSCSALDSGLEVVRSGPHNTAAEGEALGGKQHMRNLRN